MTAEEEYLAKSCNCISTIEAEILPDQVIAADVLMGIRRCSIELLRSDGRREYRPNKSRSMLAMFCPFCGNKYPYPPERTPAP